MVDGNVKWCNHTGKQFGVSYKLNIHLPYDPAIVLLGSFPKERKTYGHEKIRT